MKFATWCSSDGILLFKPDFISFFDHFHVVIEFKDPQLALLSEKGMCNVLQSLSLSLIPCSLLALIDYNLGSMDYIIGLNGL